MESYFSLDYKTDIQEFFYGIKEIEARWLGI
jgi:hypothetical protein